MQKLKIMNRINGIPELIWLLKMTNLILIAAVAENNVIGRNGEIPWNISEDMKHFKELTMGHPVIMGRKTYKSIPKRFRPLPQRKNIVLSKTLSPENGIYIARTIEEALELDLAFRHKEILEEYSIKHKNKH